LLTPSTIIQQIQELSSENQKGANALYEAERRLAEAELTLDTVEQKAFIKAQGTVADRAALARLESADSRFQRDLRRAEVNRIKVKLKALESALMANATMAKLMDTESRL
jgi:hypothetical protein